MSSLESNSSSESEAVPNSLPLEPGKAHPLSSFPPSIEVLEGTMEIPECFLWCALGAFIHPGKMCPLQAGQQFMLLHDISEPCLSLTVVKNRKPLVKTPVVGKASDSRMPMKRNSLRVVRVEFVSVGSIDQHDSQRVVIADQFKLIQKPAL